VGRPCNVCGRWSLSLRRGGSTATRLRLVDLASIVHISHHRRQRDLSGSSKLSRKWFTHIEILADPGYSHHAGDRSITLTGPVTLCESGHF
jgi:hypothetical protein